MTPGTLFLIALVLIALIFVIQLVLRWAALRREAREEWVDLSTNTPEQVSGVREEDFHRAYLRTHGPNGATLAAAVVGLNAALTPFALVVLMSVWHAGWIANGRPPMFSETTLVWQFYLFFGLIAIWGGVAFWFARVFHRRGRVTLDAELQRLVRVSS